jgi:tetratricopeptide (TPR) repeat protein
MPTLPAGGSARRALARGVLIGLLLLCIVAGAWWWSRRGTVASGDELLTAARGLALRKNYAAAEAEALRVEAGDPLWAESRLLAGELATRDERFDDALRIYQSIPRDGSEPSVTALNAMGEILLQQGRFSEADESFSLVVAEQPDYLPAHKRLASIRHVCGDRWGAVPHYLWLVEGGHWTLTELAELGDVDRPVEFDEPLRRMLQQSPDDPLVIQSWGAHAIAQGRYEEARHKLQQLVESRKDATVAILMLCEVSLKGDERAFLNWHSQLPADADANPETWYLRGLWCRQQGDLPAAARALWEALRRVPAHRRATYVLGQVLGAMEIDSGAVFAQRAEELVELTQLLDRVLQSDGSNEQAMQRVSELMLSLGRFREARAWAMTSQAQFPRAEWPVAMLAAAESKITPQTPQTHPDFDLARQIDLSHFPLPELPRGHPGSSTDPESASGAIGKLVFDDVAIESGMEFVYHNGDLDPATHGARMFEQTGGGVGVLDYDLDGWPDLYLPQGTVWPADSPAPVPDGTLLDELFRNQQGQRFSSVATRARCDDDGFGQGVSVGDFNADGLPDLYVAHVGRNQLFENNGDGTFADVTARAEFAREDWTTSCLVADLNADALPDLFDVNYVTGPRIYQMLCQGYGCSPKNFAGVPARLLINRGDGSFTEVPDATPAEDAKGLGVLAFDLETRGRPSLFIANDQVPNFFLKNEPLPEFPGVSLSNEGFLRGLAFNDEGLAMACMGIAAGDADGNGLLDLFVTNFRDEPNTLYLQDTPGLFVDGTTQAGLYEPSLPYVGWGTQFLDADNDGDLDLVLVNGHIDDYRSQGQGHEMPAQLFRNDGRARFAECLPGDSGTFFGRDYLGRGLARLDWNRDGLPEFAVSNQKSPASLTLNRSSTPYHFLQVGLSARDTAREAIGAVVTVETDQGKVTQQLTAGDGYMASNERLMHVGLGTATTVRELRVEWPSGREQTFTDVPADTALMLVEEVDRPFILPRGGDVRMETP